VNSLPFPQKTSSWHQKKSAATGSILASLDMNHEEVL
jgi:DNA repair ATPase RecN